MTKIGTTTKGAHFAPQWNTIRAIQERISLTGGASLSSDEWGHVMDLLSRLDKHFNRRRRQVAISRRVNKLRLARS